MMAPCTYAELALGTALAARICFRSLEFADIDEPTPDDGLFPGQALRFGDLDFIADHMGQLRLGEGNAASPHIPTPNKGPALIGPAIVNPDALACRIDAYLRANPEPELSRRVVYVLANAFSQLSRSGPLPPEAKF